MYGCKFNHHVSAMPYKHQTFLYEISDLVHSFFYCFYRRGPGQEYLKETLQALVEDVNYNLELNLEVHPVKVYTEVYNIIDNEQNNITMERALKDPKVAEKIKFRLKGLEDIASQFFDAIIASLDFVPYGIRWLCKAIYQLCRVCYDDLFVIVYLTMCTEGSFRFYMNKGTDVFTL